MPIIGSFMVPHPPLIVKEVGKGQESQVSKTIESYEKVAKEIAELKPDTIIISSPHAPYYSNSFYISNGPTLEGSFSNFGASNVKFNEEIDLDLVNELDKLITNRLFPAVIENEQLDHGTMVPLYFIRKYLSNFKLLVVGLSSLTLTTNYEFGMLIRDAVNNLNKRVVFVASGDLSHKLQEYGPYGFIKEGPIYDNKIIDTMSNARFNELMEYDEEFLEKSAECGHRSFTIMAGSLDGLDIEPNYYSHEDITGVGYGICSFYPKEKNDNRIFINKYYDSNDIYVRLAKDTINEYIKNNRVLDIPDYVNEEMLNNKNGVFVSIHKYGNLRGCIGTFLPTKDNIALEIISNAISASTKDPRFIPINKHELDYLNINVDILSTPENIDSKEELDVKKYGVIVSKGFKRGLLLPDLEGIDTVDEQINIAKQKAGIKDNEEVELQRFEVERHK